MNRILVAVSVAVLSLVLGHAAQAQAGLMSKVLTQGEWAVLPAYCVDTQAGPYGGPEGGEGLNRSPRAREWVGKMGTDFWHMHHYCYALRDLRRVNDASATPRQKQALYERAQSDLGYVIRTCSRTMPLLPEVFYRLGEVNLNLNDIAGAQLAFEQSRLLKPDYWPAYTAWSDVLVKLKQTDTAKALLLEGLRYSPESGPLLQRLAAIDPKARPPVRAKPPAEEGAASAAAPAVASSASAASQPGN